MKPEKLLDALTDIGEDLYDEDNLKPPKPKHKKLRWTAFIAALLAIAILCTAVFYQKEEKIIKNGSTNRHFAIHTDNETQDPILGTDDPELFLYNGSLAMAVYPSSPVNPYIVNDDVQTPIDDWKSFYEEMDSDFKELGIDLDSFYNRTCKAFFKDSNNKNLIYSPVNLYMALAMLAEISDGESRQELLALTDCTDIEQLRRNAEAIWKACYKNDGASSLILANSLWLDDSYDYNTETLNTLAECYFASSFEGETGSEEFNNELRHWLNEQTNNILEDAANDVVIAPDTILTLASTINFNAKWKNKFKHEDTSEDIFFSPNGEISCEFMNQSCSDIYFWNDNFSAIRKIMSESGAMYLILPDEGYSPEDILSDDSLYDFISQGYEWDNQKQLTINLSVPKFDVSSTVMLNNGLKELGVTSIFETSADNLKNITDSNGAASAIQHSVRVNIDEEGCEAAAFTLISLAGSSKPPTEEVDLVFNRPFVFVITNEAGIPLYTGIVNTP